MLDEQGQRIVRHVEARLLGTDQPEPVIQAAGAWLAVHLGPEGFTWLSSRKTLQKTDHNHIEQIHLHSRRGNRAGQQIMLRLVLNVRDRGLAQWRHDHPHQAIRNDGYLCGHGLDTLLGTCGLFDGIVGLTHQAKRIPRLQDFLTKLQQVALPWFASTADPDRLPADVPDATLLASAAELTEWLVYRGATRQARALVERWLTLAPDNPAHFAVGRELALSGAAPDHSDLCPGMPQALGWTATVLKVA
ncbi:hypothetical protein [Actinomadura kijaniata]|uniref:hypothetical protein n=1 Tax=Actinomadura kijaniata TaxID=46161 RepID=UPI0012FB30B3|nr:hypothetical protein [Actinomadura kijaniata]